MHDPKRTVPTFLVFSGGFVFLAGLAVAWVIDLAGSRLLPIAGGPVTTGFVVTASALATMGMQWLLTVWWQRWNTPTTTHDEGKPLRLPPDKRQRLQTGQGA